MKKPPAEIIHFISIAATLLTYVACNNSSATKDGASTKLNAFNNSSSMEEQEK